MTLKTILFGAASALVLSAGAANAVPATAETSLNVRSGPGTQYEVVGSIPAGATVDVRGCTGSWCRVSFSGGSGYASRSYLAMAEGGPAIAVAPGYAYDDGPYYDDYYDDGYGYGPSFGFSVNSGRRFHRRGGNWDRGHAWNGGGHNWANGGGRNWNGGGHNWHGGGAPGSVTSRQGFAGPPVGWQRPGTGIGAGGHATRSAPTGMGAGGFRGGAAFSGGAHAGGAPAGGGGGHAGGGAPAGGGAGGGFAGSIAKH
jgi:hypothetical protein